MYCRRVMQVVPGALLGGIAAVWEVRLFTSLLVNNPNRQSFPLLHLLRIISILTLQHLADMVPWSEISRFDPNVPSSPPSSSSPSPLSK